MATTKTRATETKTVNVPTLDEVHSGKIGVTMACALHMGADVWMLTQHADEIRGAELRGKGGLNFKGRTVCFARVNGAWHFALKRSA